MDERHKTGKGQGYMDVYRSPMEKILQQQENDSVITNPKEPAKTLLRKIVYRRDYWWAKIKKLFT